MKSDNTLSVAGIYYKYDQTGNEIESIMYNLDSTINSKNNYKYNKYGQQIENILMWGNNIKSITKSNFDRLNRKEEVIRKERRWWFSRIFSSKVMMINGM